MKKKALFIPASIRSHVLPSFFLADLFSKDYDVTYAVTNKILEESVIKNGFKAQQISKYKVGANLERTFIEAQGKKGSFLQLVQCYFTNALYWHRKREIDRLVECIKPVVVVIDIYNSTDFIFFHSYYKKINVLFFNPMPSTYKVDGFPIVSENVWLRDNFSIVTNKRTKLSDFIKAPQEPLLDWLSQRQLRELIKSSKVPVEFEFVKNKFVKTFRNVPELLLLPLEFEFSPIVKKDYQHYLGLCQRVGRIDTELDNTFDDKWKIILEKKQEGQRIIYCSFGTFFKAADPRMLDFINKVLDAIATIPNTFLVCSVNKYVSRTLLTKRKNIDNALFFSRVPQLKVLEIADIFITHGGLGGMKESIFHKVPMLVYPLDPHYDQNGNSLKVEHHGIGLRGNFIYEQTKYMQAKIKKLLSDRMYKKNIIEFNAKVNNTYTPSYHKELLDRLLT
nr:glycosyltransferase [Rudanella paleaurantiibacter]